MSIMVGDPLDIEDFRDLDDYLRTTGRIGPAETPAYSNLAGGVSNRAVLVKREGGNNWVLKQALGRLRVKVEWLSDPRRIEREALGMQWLGKLAPPGTIPKLLFLDASKYLLAMEAVPQPHYNWKTLLLAGQVDARHVQQFARLLGSVHRKGWERRDEVAPAFNDRSFFESLRLEPYYLYTASQVPDAAEFFHHLVKQTRATRYTLVHGDYSPKNVLVQIGRLILLDHEVIHFGDGAFDLGFSLTHLLSKAHHFPDHRSEFATAAVQYWKAYREEIGNVPWATDLEQRAVRHTLACLLARCAGRSPLEYLSENERRRQTQVVINIMRRPPDTIEGIVEEFVGEL